MIKYLDYISDAVIKCKMQHNSIGKYDLIILYANKQLENIINSSIKDILNKNMTKVFPMIDNSIFDWPKILCEAAMTNDNKVIEQYVVTFEKYLRFNVFGYSENTFYVAITDLTEKKNIKRQLLERDREIQHLEEEMKSKANLDFLTKIYNFQYITESISNSIENYQNEGINFCILLIDIDNFKDINKTYTIKAGDDILCDVAQLLCSIARKIDVVGRYGSNKFIIIFNNMDIDISKIMAQRFKVDIEKYAYERKSIKLSISGTLVEYNEGTLEDFLNLAEKNIEKAKSIGPGTIIS